ncbi:MAG: YtxH domain-containing protein [Desulfitobacteriaceae bacterium]|nr:YtxH domain-containing protein [Desulfitobacteriaceae bacterium]MDI6878013.1 YtxH domain-containing protein [Desulfitobacteriaceae bacterium]MDI6914184.1 YtxH domain-containing protein [Desulfitobacteriaceae bacterium]
MRSRYVVGGLVTGSVAGAAIGLLMLPRQKRSSLMRQGMRLWAKGRKVWH